MAGQPIVMSFDLALSGVSGDGDVSGDVVGVRLDGVAQVAQVAGSITSAAVSGDVGYEVGDPVQAPIIQG